MKKTFNILLAGLLLAGLTACEGNSDEKDPAPNKDIQAPYTLSVDKNEIEANGKDEAKFILKDANGTVLSEGTQAGYIVYENTVTEKQLAKKATGFTAVKNGTYTFKALYKNKPSENTVTITAKNRASYEKYFRKVVAYDVTNVNCGFCPAMASALEGTVAEWKQHMSIFAVHGPYDQKDPYIIGNVANSLLSKFVGMGSYPSCIFNLNYTMTGAGDAKPSFIAGVIEDQLREYPATCGIRINSTYDDANKKITIEAGLTSSTGGKYDLGFALLMDNGVYVGGTEQSNLYHNIVMAISGNFMAMSDQAFSVEANQEKTQSFELDLKNPIASDKMADYRVAIFALRNDGTQTIIDNVAECKLGENIAYVENK